MAFKIVNGKLVKVDINQVIAASGGSQTNVTGTLGNITTSPTAPKITSTPQKITLGSSAPKVAAPVVPTISAGSNVQQAIQQQASSPVLSPLSQSLSDLNVTQQQLFNFTSGLGAPAAPPLSTSTATAAGSSASGLPQHLQNVQAQQGSAFTGTLGLGKPQQVTDVRDFAVPSLAGEIVTGGQLRQQNFFKTLNNPRTVGEFEALGALPSIQAAKDAFFRGEDVPIAFIRFMLNQGLITEDDVFGLDLDASGAGFGGGGGGGTSFGPRTVTQFPGGRVPGARFLSLGLTNWRI